MFAEKYYNLVFVRSIQKWKLWKLKKKLLFSLPGLAASSKVPTFTWLEKGFSPSGVPLLSIDFHDGKPADVALLKHYNPIPKQVNEREENIDKCIFNGHLRDESKVYVTLTGGCPFDSTFDVSTQLHRQFFLQ